MKIKIAEEPLLIVKEGFPELAQQRTSILDVWKLGNQRLMVGDATEEELPKYCDVIIARWESLTGQTAQLLFKPL
jgi:hypothetical protein